MVAAAIRSVLAQSGLSGVNVEIIVCDDDPATSARDIVSNISRETAAPITYVVSASQNIATCRNTCINNATGDWIAFIDDDETAEHNWLSELLFAQARFKADVVKGSVKAAYPPNATDWLVAIDPFTRDFGPTGTRLDTVPTNGVIFRRAIAADNGIRFDPKYGRSGGEDVDFFRRLGTRAGAVIISCCTAVVYEHVELYRLRLEYLRHRYRITGRIYCISTIMVSPTIRIYINVVRSSLVILASSLYPAAIVFSKPLGFKMLTRFWSHVGIIEGVFGRRSDSALDREPG
jgi:succinoglycan biosynthesis protein ExoM